MRHHFTHTRTTYHLKARGGIKSWQGCGRPASPLVLAGHNRDTAALGSSLVIPPNVPQTIRISSSSVTPRCTPRWLKASTQTCPQQSPPRHSWPPSDRTQARRLSAGDGASQRRSVGSVNTQPHKERQLRPTATWGTTELEPHERQMLCDSALEEVSGPGRFVKTGGDRCPGFQRGSNSNLLTNAYRNYDN